MSFCVADLPPLKGLVDRWAVASAIRQAHLPGSPSGVEGTQLLSDDGGGSWATLDVLDAGQAVLRAWDRDEFGAQTVPTGTQLAQQYPAWAHPYLPSSDDRTPTHLLAVWEDGQWHSAGHDALSRDSAQHVLPMHAVEAMVALVADLVEAYVGAGAGDVDEDALPPAEGEVAQACALGARLDATTLARLVRHPGLDAEAGVSEAQRFATVLG
ncbi:hypothetical protein ACL90Y_08450 [Micrococcus luteus]